jgi:hypothetical protein
VLQLPGVCPTLRIGPVLVKAGEPQCTHRCCRRGRADCAVQWLISFAYDLYSIKHTSLGPAQLMARLRHM